MRSNPETPRSVPPPLVLGVVGGIASGKSLAARSLAGPGGEVVDADAIAHEVLASREVADRLRERFGPEAIGADGRPDRAFLATRAFADPAERALLEGWIHPPVRARILARLEEARREGRDPIVLDVPLLLETEARLGSAHGLASHCDAVVFVDAPREARERRAREARGWSPAEIDRRESAQLPIDEKRERADRVLPNDGTPTDLEAAARALIETLRRERAGTAGSADPAR